MDKLNPIPENVKASLDNALNAVSMAEAEYTRIKKLTESERSSLVAIQEEKITVETKLKDLTANLDSLVDDIASKKMTLVAIGGEISSSKEELITLMEQIESSRNSIVKAKASLDAREANVSAYEENINTRNLELTARETEHAAKVEKLMRAMN